MAKIVENAKFVDDLQQALMESLAVFPDSKLKSEQKLTIENIVGRRDVFGQLPTGFGKSVIFSAAVRTKAYRFFFGVCHLPVTITFPRCFNSIATSVENCTRKTIVW